MVTAWIESKYGVFSGPYFLTFGLNTDRYSVSLPIQSKCGKMRTRKNSVFEQFSRSELYRFLILSVTLTVNTWITSTSPLFEVVSPLYFHLSSRNWLSEPWFGRKHVTCVKLPWSFFFLVSVSHTLLLSELFRVVFTEAAVCRCPSKYVSL